MTGPLRHSQRHPVVALVLESDHGPASTVLHRVSEVRAGAGDDDLAGGARRTARVGLGYRGLLRRLRRDLVDLYRRAGGPGSRAGPRKMIRMHSARVLVCRCKWLGAAGATVLVGTVAAVIQPALAGGGGGGGEAGTATHQHLDSQFSHNRYYYDRGYAVHRVSAGGVANLVGPAGERYYFFEGNWF